MNTNLEVTYRGRVLLLLGLLAGIWADKFDQVASIQMYTEKVEPVAEGEVEPIPATFYVFKYKNGDSVEVKRR